MTPNEQAATPDPARPPAVDEVLRRIGRNMLLFQRIEQLLKYLMEGSRIEGPVGSVKQLHEERRARIHRQTMGQLAGQFAGDFLVDASEGSDRVEVDQAWFSFRFSISTDSTFVEQHNAEMKVVVDARNDLIHHFLPRWTPESSESTQAALLYLDDQRAKAIPMLERLQSFAQSLQKGVSEHAAYLVSPEGERQLELQWLQGSRLVLLLGELATRTPRADGWMDLATAGQVIKQLEPVELEDLNSRFGHRTLKRILVASELFEVKDEPLAKGGTRTLYRIDPHYELRVLREREVE